MSILLVFAMVATCFVAFSVTSSAAIATELPTSWGAELPEGAVAWGSGDMTTASTSLKGTGEDESAWGKTKDNPYLINNVADFMYFVNTAAAAATADTYFKMTGDIYFPVMSSTSFANASKSEANRSFAPVSFAGNLDGNGHTIWNPKNGYKAGTTQSTIFSTLDGATVENLTIKGAFFANLSAGYSGHAAGLANTIKNGGVVRNCHVVDAYLAGNAIGGLIQTATGDATIEKCTVSGVFAPVTEAANTAFGGIIAYVDASGTISISGCESNISCSTDDKTIDVGGIVGYIKKASGGLTISNCKNYGSYSTTATTVKSIGVGGILGRVVNGASLAITNCKNYGDLTSSNNCGGILGAATATGSCKGITMTGCANYGNITAKGQSAGGIIGCVAAWISEYSPKNCANYGNIQAANCAGGYVGTMTGPSGQSAPTIKCENFANYGNITATGKFAGLVAGFYSRGNEQNDSIVVNNSVLTGNVSAVACAGSICGGYATTTKADAALAVSMTNSYVSCAIKATERSGAISGGFVADTDTEVGTTYSDTTGLALNMTDAKFHVTLNGATPAYDYFVTTTTDGVTTTEGKSASLTSLDTAELTNGTALAALNTYASANTLGAWVQGTNAPELESFYQAPTAVQVTLDGATLALRDTMTLKLFVKASSVSEITDLATIVVNDGTKDYTGAFDAEAENYVFEIAGLAAKDMGTAKTYTVKYTLASDTANPIVCDTGVTYSPLQYAINMYEKNAADTTPNANFAALLTSMVRYMDAAGATDAMTTFASATGYVFGDTTDAYTAIVNKDKDSTYTLTSETAELGAELTSGIILRVKPASGMTLTSVKIGDTALTITSVEGEWRVTGINPGDLYNELTFTFTTTEGTVTGTYSIARYLNSYVGTASETLAKATALYMDAFITYKTLG
ncbi:MAG: hypothetical protein SPI22_00130 [Eubacteriales bacterium]|nr:hypothetical protein [Eubacteriales bacterium]